jgi:hypothetical protein
MDAIEMHDPRPFGSTDEALNIMQGFIVMHELNRHRGMKWFVRGNKTTLYSICEDLSVLTQRAYINVLSSRELLQEEFVTIVLFREDVHDFVRITTQADTPTSITRTSFYHKRIFSRVEVSRL